MQTLPSYTYECMKDQWQERIPVLLMVRELGIGGTERQLVETARFLDRERFVPHVGCFRPSGLRRTELEQAGVPILHLPVYSFSRQPSSQARCN